MAAMLPLAIANPATKVAINRPLVRLETIELIVLTPQQVA
jgi:hypothetical protein